MGENEQTRRCPVCGGAVVGRRDKKFCSDSCRVFYHNELKQYRKKKSGVLDKLFAFFRKAGKR